MEKRIARVDVTRELIPTVWIGVVVIKETTYHSEENTIEHAYWIEDDRGGQEYVGAYMPERSLIEEYATRNYSWR